MSRPHQDANGAPPSTTLHLGYVFQLHLDQFGNPETRPADYTIAQFVAALHVSTTLQQLEIVNFVRYWPTPENNRRVLEPLCQSLAHLRHPNHPLWKLILRVGGTIRDPATLHVMQQCVTAAHQGGIHHLQIVTARHLPVAWLVNHCCCGALESLHLWNVSLSDNNNHSGTTGVAALPMNQNHDDDNDDLPPDSIAPVTTNTTSTLNQLALRDICFETTRAAAMFEQTLAEHVAVASLELCKITIRYRDEDKGGNRHDLDDHAYDIDDFEDDPEKEIDDDDDDDEEEMEQGKCEYNADGFSDDDHEWSDSSSSSSSISTSSRSIDTSSSSSRSNQTDITSRIVAKLVKPSVEQLSLTRLCRTKHFQIAMELGKGSVINLWVALQHEQHPKLQMLAGMMIRDAVQLNNLTLRNLAHRPWLRPDAAFFHNVTACTTLTRLQLMRLHSKAVSQLQNIVTRNTELARFMATPTTFMIEARWNLVSQFATTNCPTGLYLLTRALPAVIPFDKIKSKGAPTTKET